jgi:hypothetical protein
VSMLDNPQHEKFAQLVASGMDKTEAYLKISPGVTRDSACSAGARLFASVCQRVRSLQAASADETVMDIRERRQRLARAVRLNLTEFDAKRDGDLIIGLDRIEGTDGEPGIIKIKLDSKRSCIMSDAELAGEIPEKPSASITINNQVNVVTITEERRAELIEKRRQANERLRERRLEQQAKDNGEGKG